MSTAYVIQITTPVGTRYFGQSRYSRESRIPKFFNSKKAVLARLPNNGSDEHISIIVISDLHKGLKDSKAQVMSVPAFIKSSASQPVSANNPRAFYKVQMGDGSLIGEGRSATRFGKIWNKPGHVRSFLSGYVNVLEKMTVIETIMAPDLINVESIQKIPALTFYLESKTCRANYEQRHAALKKDLNNLQVVANMAKMAIPPAKPVVNPAPQAFLNRGTETANPAAAQWPGFAKG